MIVVIPVSHVDIDMAEELLTKVIELGKVDAEVVLVFTHKAYWDADRIATLAKAGFAEASVRRLQDECEEGWPESCNHLFYGSARMVAGNAFYFMEADNMPLSPGWFDELLSEYRRAGKPYMGVIGDTKYLNRRTGEKITRGKHMVGTGIYPADFLKICPSVHYMDRRPYDICIEEDVVPLCHHTDLIAHRWGTVNYRRENGAIVMDDRDPQFEYAAPIPPQAVVVHGCKDGSLFKLLDPRQVTS